MRIGSSVALLAIGAILSFGISDRLNGVDLVTIGYIVMAAGVLGIVLSLVLAGRKSTSVTRESVVGANGNSQQRVVESEGSNPVSSV